MNAELLKRFKSDSDDEDQYDQSMVKEGERVVAEITFGVEYVSLSKELENSDSISHINIRTLEKEDYCVELSSSGYVIVGKQFDTIDANLKAKNLALHNKYESCDALMHEISKQFGSKFNTLLSEKLQKLI